ncbi:MAG: hypothetical protein NC206_05370 [Bacteroides sp.]|nr:hypothetical protein [Roseburia sp.]MCM1346495.1 hypothetical protein [Bacteroides sp.]MCM1421047.1 hypothetical protein [Bacteroides sp.]
MKRLILSVIASLALSLGAFSQETETRPRFLGGKIEWVDVHTSHSASDFAENGREMEVIRHYTDGDTIFDGKRYAIVRMEGVYWNIEEANTDNLRWTDWDLQYYLREDEDGCVWINLGKDWEDTFILGCYWSLPMGGDCLLYDFSDRWKETKTVRYGVLGHVAEDEVRDTHYMELLNGEKCLVVNDIMFGIGYDGQGPLAIFRYLADCGYRDFLSFSRDGVLLYENTGLCKAIEKRIKDVKAEYLEVSGKFFETWQMYGSIYDADGNIVEQLFNADARCDSVVNDVAYKVLDCRFGKFLYRVEGNRVYRLSENDRQEHLVFDYNLNVGDTFVGEYGQEMRVTGKTDTLIRHDIRRSLHKMITLESVDGTGYRDVWVEGIGSVNTGLLTPVAVPELLSCKVAYAMMDEFVAGFSVDSRNFKICPFFMDEEYEGEKAEVSCRIVDGKLHISGLLPMFCNHDQYLLCQLESNKANIRLADLPPYVDCWGYHEIEVTLPGFDDYDEYTLTFRTIDGDIEVTVTADVKNGISSVAQDNDAGQGTVYDLSGRRLSGKPEKGMYIQNGKKYVVR